MLFFFNSISMGCILKKNLKKNFGCIINVTGENKKKIQPIITTS